MGTPTRGRCGRWCNLRTVVMPRHRWQLAPLLLLTAATCPTSSLAELARAAPSTGRSQSLRRALRYYAQDEVVDVDDEEQEMLSEQPPDGSKARSSSYVPEFSPDKFLEEHRASALASQSPASLVVEPKVRSSHLKPSREEKKSLAAGLPERVPKLHVFGQASEQSQDYIPRIYQDNFVGVKVSKSSSSKTKSSVKDATHKLQETQLGYVPGTLTPHVKGLSAEHISNKTLAAFNRKMDRKGRYALDGKSCALVGNSGLLKQTSYGRDIDNHDVIFRFNAAPTQGYEEIAGSLTDVRIINNGMGRELVKSVNGKMKSTTLNELLGSKNTAVWLRSDERVADDLKKALMKRSDRRPVVWMSKEVTYAPLLLMHQFYAEELKAVMGAHPHSPSYDEWYDKLKEARIGEQRLGTPTGSHMFGKPSTGISLIYLLKDLCRSLDVYGFGTHDAAGNPGDYKYYDVMKMSIGQTNSAKSGSPVHSFDLETELELAMAKDGMFKYCRFEPGNDANNQRCTSVPTGTGRGGVIASNHPQL